MPDYRHVLNEYIWQEYDTAPDHPELFKFIEFWQKTIDGVLNSVSFTHQKKLMSGEWVQQVGVFNITGSGISQKILH